MQKVVDADGDAEVAYSRLGTAPSMCVSRVGAHHLFPHELVVRVGGVLMQGGVARPRRAREQRRAEDQHGAARQQHARHPEEALGGSKRGNERESVIMLHSLIIIS